MSTFVDPRKEDSYKSQRLEKQALLLLGAILDQQIIANGKSEPAPAPEPKRSNEPSRGASATNVRR